MPEQPHAENRRIAMLLREAADQGANPFRVRAYRRAGDTIEPLPAPVRAIFEARGRDGLTALEGVGEGIASAVAEILITGRWAQLERLRGDLEPEKVLQAVPGIGPDLATRIHDTLHVDTLEALENTCRDGRVGQVPGIGPRRAAALCAALASMLDSKRAQRRPGPRAVRADGPGIDVLLDIDREYRDKAAAKRLPTIAPKRFNPTGEAWLPVLHARRGAWHFTALYSNTARAHELGRTRDWVVIYFYDDEHAEGQHTVVTETRGLLVGKRVVRGREAECRARYTARPPAPAGPSARPEADAKSPGPVRPGPKASARRARTVVRSRRRSVPRAPSA